MMRLMFLFVLILYVHMSWARVEFKGVREDDQKEILRVLPQLDQSEDWSQYDRTVRLLMATTRYSFVQVSKNNETFLVQAWPLQSIASIQVKGQKQISRDEIVELLDLNAGSILTPDQLDPALDRLIKVYEERGFLNAKIDVQYVQNSKGQSDLVLDISEGIPCRVEAVVFRTPNPFLVKILNRTTASFKNRTLSEERLNDIKTKVHEELNGKKFLTSKLSDPTVEFNGDKSRAKIFYTIERPYRYEFFFEGNTVFSTEDLLLSFDIDKVAGSALSPKVEFENLIKSKYIERGYAKIDVEARERAFENDYLQRVYFRINENARTVIANIKVQGKMSRDPDLYAKRILKESPTLIRNGYYNRSALEIGLQKLLEDLQGEGYLKAQILSVRPEWNERNTRVEVVVTLDEGPRTFIQSIEFENLKVFSKNDLLDSINLRPQKPLSLDDLEASIETLKSKYKDSGYLEFEIQNENASIIQYNEDQTFAQIRFVLKEGAQIKAHNIRVEGNSFTKPYVILNEIDFVEGEVLTPQKIQVSVFRLQKMGLFSKVDITTLDHGSLDSNRTVIVQVQERQPGLFFTGAGITNENQLTYRGFLGSAYRNINGTGRAVSGRIDLKYSTYPLIDYVENRASISYLEPYLFGRRTRGRFTLERYSEVFQIAPPNVVIQENIELRSYLEHEFSRNSKFVWNLYTFSNLKTFNRRAPYDEKTLNIASVGPFIELDHRNDIVNPTAGNFTRFDFEYADPILGSSNDSSRTIQFLRTTGNIVHYQPFQKSKFVWVNALRGGYLANVSRKENSGVPAVKMFFLGSQSTIRGFNPGNRELFPTVGQLGVDQITDYFAKRDSHFYLLKSELRYQLFGSFGLQAFYDGGAVLISGEHFKDPYRDAIGGGFRFMTPVGAVTLEMGWKLDKKVNEDPFAIHFSIGNN